MSSLVEHFERFLGPITSGSKGDETTPAGVQVMWFGPDQPYPGVMTLSTLGLHRYHLGDPDGRGVHQELLFHVTPIDKTASVAGVLFHVAGMMVQRNNGLQRGQVIGPAGPLFGGGDLTALYIAAPSSLPDEFQIFHANGHHVEIVWLVPITDAEAAYVHTHGWSAFEEVLKQRDPELADVNRQSVLGR